ncbi:DNA mismatch repair protein [Erysipelotrichaceae bacterium HCN-30851]
MNRNEIIQNIQIEDEQMKYWKKRSYFYSNIRAVTIILAIIFLFYGYYQNVMGYIPSCIMLFGFIYAVWKHRTVKAKYIDHEVSKEVWEDILCRKEDQWKEFADTGEEFLTEELTQAYDLDLLGKASLYQYLCVAKTPFGRKRLAALLSCQKQSLDEMEKRSEAVQELAKQKTFTLFFIKICKIFARHRHKKKLSFLDDLIDEIEKDDSRVPSWLQYAAYTYSILILAVLVLSLLHIISFSFFLIFSVISLCIGLLFFIKQSKIIGTTEPLIDFIADYEPIFQAIQNFSFNSEVLCNIQNDMEMACTAAKELHKITLMIQIRSNSIFFFISNALALFDTICVISIQKWKQRYGKAVRKWLMDIADLEAYASLAQIAMIKEESCNPNYQENTPYFNAKDLYHPLLSEEKCVKNSIELKDGTYLITGSNMSGKTTFLRTVGINMVLMHAGAAICAKQFSASTMHVFTSMRVHDNVSEGISTFYAEIQRIQKMNEASKKKEDMLVLIDEIFKGTNSADRLYCATNAIRHLHKPWIITMVSTHDFELCDLENDENVQAHNYHFSEYYEDGNICFDYQLKQGKCTTTNARELMRLAGFEEVL